ncbi:MAG: hypothetical protein PF518_08170 [Spirochaetaceae bacterium]|jgi:hypothetical protein|nr:hypothetical protein [Spirochaetaceae bacterium]
MGKIKSALELAMEKTADMTVDREKLKQNELRKAGQILASSILNSEEKDCESKLKSYSSADLPFVKSGFGETLISNIRLPLYLNSDNKLKILQKSFRFISEREEIYTLVFNQLGQLFDKYIDDIQNLLEGLKQQYIPILQQKQQQYFQKTGQNIQINPEQDPEFMEILSSNRKALEEQYNTVIAQAKDELKKII